MAPKIVLALAPHTNQLVTISLPNIFDTPVHFIHKNELEDQVAFPTKLITSDYSKYNERKKR